ncbi:MAG: hypothetical protein JWO30_2840 [Fibrobacteres bacterium]|nr:hypothetical protein [Fibrobacterota bacterium]
MPSLEFYLNSDFDLSLRGRPSLLESPDPTFVHEMAWHFLFAGGKSDSLIVHRPLPGDFLAYLAEKGLALPRIVVHPDYSAQSVFTPFGWNAHAEGLAERYAGQPAHPDSAAVKTANSRVFSLAWERECAGAEPPGGYGSLFVSLPELEDFLHGRAEPEGWVVKGNHGHAGTANRRVPSGPLAEVDRQALAQLLEEHGCVVAEPWQQRLMDMSVNFSVEKGGALKAFRGHQLLNSRDGAFLGVKILPTRMPPEPWSRDLRASASALAKALDAIGYFGPVSVDAYVFSSPAGPRLRPTVDINARHSMALPAHGLADRLPGKTLLWMWSKPRKLDLPGDYRSFDARLGAHAFRRDTGTGILAVSPLALEAPGGTGPVAASKGQALRPKRVGILFSAEDEEGLARLQSGFSRAMGRS